MFSKKKNITLLIIFSLSVVSALGNKFIERKAKSNRGLYQYIYKYFGEGIAYYNTTDFLKPDSSRKNFFQKRPQSLEIKINCSISEAVIFTKRDVIYLIYEISNPTIKISNSSVDMSMVQEELTHPIFAAKTKGGVFLYLSSDSLVSLQSKRIAYSILNNFQFVQKKNKLNKWSIKESNTIGSFTAKYLVTKKNHKHKSYVKKILGYDLETESLVHPKTELNSISKFSFNSLNVLEAVDCSESTITRINNDTVTIAGNHHTLSYISKIAFSKNQLNKYTALAKESRYQSKTSLKLVLSKKVLEERENKRYLGTNNLSSLLLKIEQASNLPRNDSLVLQFKALMFLYPESCTEINELLQKEPSKSIKFNILLQSICALENDHSTEILMSLMESRKKEVKIFLEILPTFSDLNSPSDKLITFLEKIAIDSSIHKEIRSACELTLGTFVRHLKSTDVNKSIKILNFLFDRVIRNVEPLQQILILGNAGSFRGFLILKKYIMDSAISSEYRNHAVYALRFLGEKKVSIFIDKLSRDHNSVISKSLSLTAAFRKNNIVK